MELSNSNIKKVLIFFQNKAVLIFQEPNLFYISENGNLEKILYISGNGTFLYFLKKIFSYISGKVYSESWHIWI